MALLVSYHELGSMHVDCPKCGWSGYGNQCKTDEVCDGCSEKVCPSCATLLIVAGFPHFDVPGVSFEELNERRRHQPD